MLYPRLTKNGQTVCEDEMVSFREHLAVNNRLLFLTGVITGEVEASGLLMAMDSLSHDPIKLVITSPGGELDSTFMLYDTIRLLSAPVYTLGRYCASAAAILLAAGKQRYLLPHAKVMLHLPSSYFQKDTIIPLQDMEIHQREARKYKERMVELFLECGVKRSKEELLSDVDRDFWLEPEEAIAYGLADKVITPEVMQEWLGSSNRTRDFC